MSSTYSTSLKLELIGDGDQTGIWGQTTNTNLGTLLEQAITGVQSIVLIDADYTLTNLNGTSDEARNAVLVVSGTASTTRDIIAPLVNKLYTVSNTLSSQSIRIKGATGTAVSIPAQTTVLVFCDGTNFYSGLNGVPGSFSAVNNITAANMVASTNVTATSYLLGNNATITNTLTSANIAATSLFATTSNATTFNGTTINATNFKTTSFTIAEDAGVLYFYYGVTKIASLDSSGNFTTIANVTAYGTM